MFLSIIVVSCKILRDATPKSLVILDGRSSRHFLLKFIAHPKDKNLEEGRPLLYVFSPSLAIYNADGFDIQDGMAIAGVGQD